MVGIACGFWLGLAGGAVSTAGAQEQPQPDELQKMYDDALAQLKAAQARKNELGVENEQLRAKIADLEARLTELSTRADALQAKVDQVADRTFEARSQNAAWRTFLDRYPALKSQWQLFLQSELLSVPGQLPPFVDPDWPLSAMSIPSSNTTAGG